MTELRRQSKHDLGVAAACLLEAFGWEEPENEHEAARAYTGALLLAQMAADIALIAKAHTKKD